MAGVRAVIHSAGWVSLGRDPLRAHRADQRRRDPRPADDAERAGVERFVLTSTLHTLAAGTPERPADETSPWNLECVDSPYSRSKRQAELLVRTASSERVHDDRSLPGHGARAA